MAALRRLLSRGNRAPTGDDAGPLRAAFQERYHAFRLLLTSNQKALEAIARMEEARAGDVAFGMPFVRASVTEATVSVAQMLRRLDSLAPGKYEELWRRLRDIERLLEGALGSPPVRGGDALVLPLAALDAGHAALVGGKMAHLGEAANRLHLPVPPGFAVTCRGYERFMAHAGLQAEIDRVIQARGGSYTLDVATAVQQLVVAAEIPSDLAAAVRDAYHQLETARGAGVRVALRSSALGEDSAGLSFAGQYRSVLNVGGEHVLDAYKEVVASKYSLQAILYRLGHGVRDDEVAMCVGCTVMLDSRSGGVAYSSAPGDPEDAPRHVLVASAWGLPQAVVEGSGPADVYRLSRTDPPAVTGVEVARKRQRLTSGPLEGVLREPLDPERGSQPSLTAEEATAIAGIALRLEQHYGVPQDLEWAVAPDGRVFVLQCRPLHLASAEPASPAIAASAVATGGVTASPGAGSGPVFRVERHADLLRAPGGAVLVSAQASATWAPIVGRAAALVTEQGTVASHLASVARELGVPALFGLPSALEQLEGGAVVTVDASRRAVYPGRVDALLRPRPAAALAGTPVSRTLAAALEHIAPLRLVDPESPEFTPGGCRTLHDLTRFAHETAVREMFGFAHREHFEERSAKQLVVHGPMQLWVLDLDDGFRAPVAGRYVRLDDIASLPMLALWHGMSALPWPGPPPVDTRGLLSVMFQATANPGLDPAVRGVYADKNYFMIARNFCSLQSRFGFHFSTVEALVSERAGENYVAFRFQGGAADLERRRARAALVGDVLREHGFSVETAGDGLRAWVRGEDEQAMAVKLRLIGFLTIHTRQLDMVMGNEASAAEQRRRLLGGVAVVTKSAGGGRDPRA